MKPSLHKFAFTAHIALSVGWLGAVAGFLALAVAGLTSHDAQLVRGLYLAMRVTGWYVIVPLCLASLLTGLVMSLGTKWGLFRHYWVMTKFLLTVVSTLILFGFMRILSHIGVLAADTTMSIDELRNLSQSSVLHSGGGLLVLLVNTMLSVYKPWSRTRYWLRKQHEQREVLPVDFPSRPESDVGVAMGSTSKAPRWVSVVGILAIVLTLLFLVAHLIGGGMRIH
jgi:hypothetical protein